ncbi:hypothetical protein Q6333_28815, partial [Klebsiella pneumoniae]|nr:hypothetical protein [Klebsiella pneumoniae]
MRKCISEFYKESFNKRSATPFVDGLEGSASTRKRYIKKNSAFSNGLQLARMMTFETHLKRM